MSDKPKKECPFQAQKGAEAPRRSGGRGKTAPTRESCSRNEEELQVKEGFTSCTLETHRIHSAQ